MSISHFLIHRELNAAGIAVVESQAGYYIFPNFEILREKLLARGVTTGQQMCDAILSEASVSVGSTEYI